MATFGGGFSFGKTPSTTGTTGTPGTATFGSTPVASTQPALGFGTPAASTAATGFKLGSTPVGTTSSGGFAVGFNLAGTPATTSSTGFSLSGTPATSLSAGFKLGGTPATSASTGFSIGGTPASNPSTGFTLGGTPVAQATSSTLGSGLTLGATTASTGLLGTAPASTSGFGLAKTSGLGTTTSTGLPSFGSATGTTGSIFGQTLPGSTTLGGGGPSIFGQTLPKTTSTGLGGQDPKTTTASSGSTSDTSKAGEGKTVKETKVENEILLDVDAFQKFVKEEKGQMEHIKRMSSTPMMKVQEDSAALRQLLSVVSSGLQRNACAVDKLKKEMTQELKNAEMAMRTKEIPPGLQYENTAPTKYFQNLVENFETQMLGYRQQIEMLESHLASLHQPNRLTPDELIQSLRKLHLAFVAMAAQLQQVHEAVKTQKEHYLNYRKVFLGDSRNIFERQRKAPVKVTTHTHIEPYGQTPFPGMNDATAAAMATALNRSQQPQPGAPPVTGFSQTTGFGTSGLGGFGAGQTPAFKGFGTGGGTGLFGASSTLTTTQPTPGSLFSSPLPGTTTPQLGLTPGADQTFQLNKPPGKRGKR